MGNKKKSVFEIWSELGKPAAIDDRCTSKHIREIELHLERWKAFWSASGEKEPAISKIRRKHMEDWRRSLLSGTLAERSINKHLASIRKMLVIAEKHEIIPSRPRLEQLPEVTARAKPKLFFRDHQLDAMFETASELQWPNVGIEPATFWRCALILFRSYGFRTQELIAYESSKNPIRWSNVSFAEESPNPASDCKSEFGWLFYIPPKTAKKKPTPIYLPLTRHTRYALDVLRQTKRSDDDWICCNPRNQERMFETWYRWLEIAEVKPKDESLKFVPYCLRKTAATYLNRHFPGLASAVCRWGSSSEAKVAADHYVSDELVLEQLPKVPMPASFDRFCGFADQAVASVA